MISFVPFSNLVPAQNLKISSDINALLVKIDFGESGQPCFWDSLRRSSYDSRYDLGIKVNRVSFKTFSKSGRTLHENCKGLSLKLELF